MAASTQNQAFHAILFFYRHVLKKEAGDLKRTVRAKQKPYIPVVLSRKEVDVVIRHLESPYGNSGDTLLNSVFFPKLPCLISFLCQGNELSKVSPEFGKPDSLGHQRRGVQQEFSSAKVCIEGDAGDVLSALIAALKKERFQSNRSKETLRDQILKDKSAYQKEWKKSRKDRVNPALFFETLRAKLADDAITVVDDGNHTFLAAELFPVYRSRHFISPTDFNCMGYCVPGAIGAKLTNPEKQVVGIVGDGAFLMTCMEILTASSYSAGVV